MSSFSYSTQGFTDRNVEAALDAIAAAGFAQTEILGQDPHVAVPPTGRQLSSFRDRLEARGLRATTVHAPLRRNVLGAPEEGWRREVMGVLESYIRFAAAIDARELIVHPVPNPIFVPDALASHMPERIRIAVPRSLDELVPVAQEAKVRILLENLPYSCDYPYLSLKELRPLVDAYPSEWVGLVLDTGHAWTRKTDPVAEIHSAGPRLKGTHLQDVDYNSPSDNHWVPTHGGLNWDAIRQALAHVNYSGCWTFEVAEARHGESPEELARVTRELARTWGL
jgi:sugar phosphate isomerase/epimerase